MVPDQGSGGNRQKIADHCSGVGWSIGGLQSKETVLREKQLKRALAGASVDSDVGCGTIVSETPF